MRTAAHHVSLRGAAGVELQFAEFVRCSAERHPEWSHLLLNPGRSVDPLVDQLIDGSIGQTFRTKYRGALRLPSWPRAVRAWNLRRNLRSARVDTVIIWNRSARLGFLLDAAAPALCIHYEHGAAWFTGRDEERRDYFRRVPCAIANSSAAEAVLRQGWNFTGEIVVCRNALRPSLVPPDAPTPIRATAGPVRLGVAARLFPVKGVALALHALARLGDILADAELHIAGDGPERPGLEALTKELGIEGRVRFRGAVTRMADFYREIDCLLHVPISEAFGLVAIEAAAHGCPVIAAAVDGLPEAVRAGESGVLIAPTLPLSDYDALGGAVTGLPPMVYDPATKRLGPPRIVDPAELARTVAALFADERRIAALRSTAPVYVEREHSFVRYVDEVLAAAARFAAG